MKRTFIVFGLTAIAASRSFAGTLIDDPRTFPALIAHEKGMGSGCFLQLSNSVYLVTAKHVLFAEPNGTNAPALISPTAVVKSYSRAGTTNVSERVFAINLAQLLVAGEVRYSMNRDVALVRVTEGFQLSWRCRGGVLTFDTGFQRFSVQRFEPRQCRQDIGGVAG